MVIQRLTVKSGRAAPRRPLDRADLPPFNAERHRMHDAAGQQREQAGDDERASEDGDHGVAVPIDAMAPGMHDGERQRRAA